MESYVCHYNKLTTLKFGPYIVNGDYYVTNNKTLETLDTSTEVGGKLIVSDNNIYNLDEFDCKVKSSIYIIGNPISKLLGITNITKEDQDVFIDRLNLAIDHYHLCNASGMIRERLQHSTANALVH